MEKKYNFKNLTLVWIMVLFFAALFLSRSGYKSGNDDSNYYTELVIRYQNAPVDELLTPKWGKNYWNFEPNSFMRDQFPGQLLMGVALSKIGVPADQSLHILGMFFQVGSFLLLGLMTNILLSFEASIILIFSLILSPLSFSYNLRANHELGIMFFSTLALFSGFKFSSHFFKWGLVSILSTFFLLIIKGPFFIFGPILFTIGSFFHHEKTFHFLKSFLTSLISIIVVIMSLMALEMITLKLTGTSFLKEFWRIQIEQRALSEHSDHSFLVKKLLHFTYYFSHYLAYAAPVFIILLYSLFYRFDFSKLKNNFKHKSALLFLCSSMSFCLIFSTSDRIAGRYVFPGYFLFIAWCAIFFYLNQRENIEKRRWIKPTFFYTIPLLWILTFALHFR